MAQDSDEPSGATLGYLAPICVAVFFIFVWYLPCLILSCLSPRLILNSFRYRIVFGTRQRFRGPNRQLDPESWPMGFSHAILTSAELEKRFPLIKFRAWTAASGHQAKHSERSEVDPDRDSTSQAPGSIPAPASNLALPLNASEKEVQVSASVEHEVASSHGDAHRECAICMEDFDDDDSIRALTCDHIYHATCLDPWFTKRQARCPLCKTCYYPEINPAVPVRPATALIRNQIFPRVL
ncbi:hypothetical protein AN1658.2 [Aspergillus nidulans FGSC A4]|uniref:RING-type E3 ubiquitin transferase n=1 Tax=Emericella nidulans (strain FGSC A4 / ATCC 38163 / CBS 112.46 / NRRL 194 / M139) TaxID=227321 RepID=Q5BCS2_EMENI|nr:hypothetical protein [Aspergillus nidulans FGSC A4]EAA64778.1 hypothetical protein AN1658.2 [Aspergillus nidulans FGSC A4]CBF85314.1 TPA: conserved hypothetical protein [Aspergillus nidulans FGSC A4]|eukprot:XP_659262.1 hypothetical protein AN1658.2 [Aspergillus nidulans FGSC A4]